MQKVNIINKLIEEGKSMKRLIMGFLAVFLVAGCGGEVKQLQMKDTAGATKTIEFPKGTITGAASKDQSSTLAQIFVDSHNMAMEELAGIKGNEEAIKRSTQKIEEAIQKLDESSRKTLEASRSNLETAQKSLQMIEQLSRKQGTGEITLFFPVGSSVIKKGSHEYGRTANFADFLSRESRGRKVLLISIGSASAFGNKKLNQKLAKKRSEAPIEILDQYLVNIPHDVYKVYGTGDVYSPKNVTMKEHQRYQHARIIAFYEMDQVPSLPEEPAGDAAVKK
jgi:outer membrane protein OmpA-like peptidoglycan-associated protein